MNFFCVSINHKTASIDIRESFYLTKSESDCFLSQLKNTKMTDGFILSTCNRTEIYGLSGLENINEIPQMLSSFKKIKADDKVFALFTGMPAIRHLFEVISGIDSMIIGDNQIYSQVKSSFDFEKKNENFLLNKIFHAALKTGKRAITETAVGEGAVTISYAAVQLIEKIFSNLSKKSAIVIGTGETGEIAAKHLFDKKIGRIALSNRTIEKAEKLAQHVRGKIIPFENVKDYLHEYDIILTATSSPGFLFSKGDIEKAVRKRSNAATIIMDIAIPRDVDPSVRSMENVFYSDIDSLNIIVDQNIQKRKNEIVKVKAIIDEEIQAFSQWYGTLEAAPTIKILRDHFEQIRNEEVEKNINRFSAEDREKLDIVTKKIINKLLHTPTIELKKITGEEKDLGGTKISLIRELFGIDKENNHEK